MGAKSHLFHTLPRIPSVVLLLVTMHCLSACSQSATEQAKHRPIVVMPLPVTSTSEPSVSPRTSVGVGLLSGMDLASSSSYTKMDDRLPVVLMSSTELRIASLPSFRVPVPAPELAEHGFAPEHKGDDANALLVEPFAEALSRLPSTSIAEVRVAVGREVAFRPFIEVLYTLGKHRVQKFHLTIRTPTGRLGSFVTAAPRKRKEMTKAELKAEKRDLHISAWIITDGIALKTRHSNIATGCRGDGPGIAVLATQEGHDFAALKACGESLKHRANLAGYNSEFLTLTANPGTPFQEVMATADALHRTGGGESLFPNVRFGIVR